jgi:lactoylglutathione lyase
MISHFQDARLLGTMLRVRDLKRSLEFYVEQLGMVLHRRHDVAEGRFTLAFLGYGPDDINPVLALTHNWDARAYEIGDGYPHTAISVLNVYDACAALAAQGVIIPRAPAPMQHDPSQHNAFISDPDGYRIDLIQRNTAAPKS